ncbi:methyltransferase family protein [Rhodophyticola porphyridii]|uniref:Isoprenylcysteine carboxylmethyltransferase family protein n=1 Tax=Rhodophyticola porphyridii TaxID=1852017 RepID=A0A3L9YAH3_9RHOB|nr:isoprenylcysteine carboxylmethyltransferase family protein [Rhodophyticola porphyridii]RMA43263.1 isoprenylcysteine carboxylmethyltransferase family protein [Rhodophyticola porphyridii]
MKGFTDLPPIWLAGFLFLAWFLARALPLVTAFGPVFRVAGGVMALAGLALIVWSAIWFARKKTTIEPHHDPQVLIVEGPYTYSRNPIYLGMLMILTGFVLWLGVLSPVLLPVLFVAVLTRRFIEPEEERLIGAFGLEARRYLQRTRRWL